MPKDVQIAEELAAEIGAQVFSKDFVSEFKFDQFIEGERVDEIKIRVSVESDERTRQTRSGWTRNAIISVFVIAPQQANVTAEVDAKAKVSDLLDFWDEVLDYIQIATPAGQRAVSIESFGGSRYDKEALQDDRQFLAGVFVSYNLI